MSTLPIPLTGFAYEEGLLQGEGVSLEDIAERHGTPCYVYSRAAIEAPFAALDAAFGARRHRICYAVKANSSLAVLNVLARLGAGFDIVSAGELERVRHAGGDPCKVVFSGIGKQSDEIRRALELNIACFNVESVPELERIQRIASSMRKKARISLRVNPDVDAQTHPYISTGLKENKFGIDIRYAEAIYERAATMSHVEIVGVDCHIGSQLTQLSPFRDAAERVMDLVARLQRKGITFKHIDFGGGLGIPYKDETPPSAEEYVRTLNEVVGDRDVEIWIEPGRYLVGNAGVLLTRVEYLKQTEGHHFCIVDAAMNDLMRPSLYSAWHEIVPVNTNHGGLLQTWDVVGPVCETGDFLGKQRKLKLNEGDLLAVLSAGAYGFVMASNYNSRPRPPEVFVDGNCSALVRPREQVADLFAGEAVLG